MGRYVESIAILVVELPDARVGDALPLGVSLYRRFGRYSLFATTRAPFDTYPPSAHTGRFSVRVCYRTLFRPLFYPTFTNPSDPSLNCRRIARG